VQAEYLRPLTLEDALEYLSKAPRVVAAGCTDIFPTTEGKALSGSVLDISGIDILCGIEKSATEIRFGATTTWTDIVRSDLPPAFDGLKQAAKEVGAKQVQNRGTLAGNLCNASPAADGVPPLLTLDAQVELTSQRRTRCIPLQDFLQGPRRTDRAPDELVTAIIVPSCKGHGAFLKLGARKHLVISIAMAAARIVEDAGKVVEAALAIGACGPVATRLPDLEARLIGHPLSSAEVDKSDVTQALQPIEDVRGDVAYRMDGATELIRRLLRKMAQGEGKE